MRFHAAPPPGEWLNDPNALLFENGRYCLYAQHAADAPDFRGIGWGRFSSPDLVSWTWEGRAVDVDSGGRRAYSGSVAVGSEGTAFALTRHDPARDLQTQEWRWPDGRIEVFGPSGRDCRDPFILRAEPGKRAVLLARPCNWTDWSGQPASHLEVWREEQGRWRQTGMIGPWHPSGVLWEVPQLIDFGARQALIVSTVDRRNGSAQCCVRYWLGRFTDDHFEIDAGFPATGRLLDSGPDFYAAIANTMHDWTMPVRIVLGWASNWDYARRMAWPDGRYGGPISLPREVTLSDCGGFIRMAPLAAHTDFVWRKIVIEPGRTARLQSTVGSMHLSNHAGELDVLIERSDLPAYAVQTAHPVGAQTMTLHLFRDGPLIELFANPAGISLTLALHGLTGDCQLSIESNQ